MKRLLPVLLALVLMMGTLPSALADLAQIVPPMEGAREKLTVGFLNSDYGPEKKNWPTDNYLAMKERLNIDFDFIGIPEEQYKVMIAGGDLPDVIMTQNQYINQLIEGGLVIPLDDYIDQMPNLISLSPLRIAALREYQSNDTGNLYWWTPQIGIEAPGTEMWNGLTIRWDIYKELGAPTIKNADEFLDLVAQAVEKYPTTPDGKKVWGIGTFNSLWGYWVPGAFYGYHNVSDAYHLRASDSVVINGYFDEEGPIWKQVDYFFKANQMGLFDPDSFTMTEEDLQNKVASGQYMSLICQWEDKYYDEAIKTDPDTLAKFMVLPVEGQWNWCNNNVKCGWSFYYGISTNCQNIEGALRWFDWLNTEEGSRFARSGPQGKLWDYDENGVPAITADAIEKKAAMTTDEWTVYAGAIWDGMVGYGNSAVLSDGGKTDLFREASYVKETLNPAQKDYAAFYGVDVPSQATLKLIDEGKAFDKRNTFFDLTGFLPSPPTEISRIDNNCREIMMRNLPDLIMAADREAYNSVKSAMMDEFKEAGIEESIAWWNEQQAPVREFIEANID